MKTKYEDAGRETIAAIITPPGEGGLGAVRIAGPESFQVIEKIFRPAGKGAALRVPFHLYYGYVVDKKGNIIDEVTAVKMLEGKSYTGGKQVEIFCHGGQYILKKILEEILKYRVRPAEPGEFTRRAFLAGRIDLARAEAVADIVASKTEYSYSAARKNLLGQLSEHIDNIRNGAVGLLAEIEASIDYPEEQLETDEKNRQLRSIESIMTKIKELVETYRAGRIIREGFRVAITGRPNAGKSSLFNLLLNQSRAIVARTPGTTRDYLTEWIDLSGMAVSLTDTAGLRARASRIEKAGQESALKIVENSHLVIWIADISHRSWRKNLLEDMNEFGNKDDILLVLNKIDKIEHFQATEYDDIPELGRFAPLFPLSCKTKGGFKDLQSALRDRINRNMPDLTERLVLTSERHKKKLENSLRQLRRAKKGIEFSASPELVAFDLRQGINEIDEITGRIYNEEILDRIFERFCIGK